VDCDDYSSTNAAHVDRAVIVCCCRVLLARCSSTGRHDGRRATRRIRGTRRTRSRGLASRLDRKQRATDTRPSSGISSGKRSTMLRRSVRIWSVRTSAAAAAAAKRRVIRDPLGRSVPPFRHKARRPRRRFSSYAK